MKARKAFDAQLGGREIFVIGALLFTFSFLWMLVISPHLLAWLRRMRETAPTVELILRCLVGFAFFPWSLIPPFIALRLYQRRYDRRQSEIGDRSD
jgi:hypothetical protein